jgi:hypothetical protein
MLTVDPIPELQQQALLKQLQRILESEFFRNSQRCSRFLEYSVHHLLQHQPGEELKERLVGVEVFGRPADYDTARDNIVRVTANEVRKRLAQYYGSLKSGDPFIFEMPPGAYVVTVREFQPIAEVPVNEAPPGVPAQVSGHISSRHGSLTRWFAAGVGLLVVLGLAIGVAFYKHFQSPAVIEQVWAPLLKSPAPVLISIAEPVAYEPASGSTIASGPTAPMVPLRDAFVGVGDAYAMADITRYLTGTAKPWRMVAGNEVPSQDLRSGPMVLIGAHSNLWTTKLMTGLRYSFGENNTVFDHSSGKVAWSLPNLRPDWETTEDYAIVTRFRSPQTGQPVMIMAGLTNFGTQAAGEFVTSPELLAAALEHAPKDWQGKNFQFVLHTRLIGHTPDQPTVLAAWFW